MLTGEIANVLSQALCDTRTHFLGVFALDQIPSSFSHYPCAYVANTDPSTRKGQHWVAFYHESPKRLEFFDSYGEPPQTYSFPFPSELSSLRYNAYPLQKLNSSVCGQYCIFFIFHRSHRSSLASIIHSLRSSPNPDRLVHLFARKLRSRAQSHSNGQSCVCKSQFSR